MGILPGVSDTHTVSGVCAVSWKDVERALAKRLDGRRVGNTGHATPDVLSDWLAAEAKTRKTLPQWLWDAVEQTVRNAPDGRLSLVVLHETHKRRDDDIVVMRLADFGRCMRS